MRAQTLDDWPNIILYGISVDDIDKTVCELVGSLTQVNCNMSLLKHCNIRQIDGSSVVVQRLTASTMPIIIVKLNQDFDALSSFFKQSLNSRSILHQSSRHVIILVNMAFADSKVYALVRRISEEFAHNAVFVTITPSLNCVPREIRDRCTALNIAEQRLDTPVIPDNVRTFLRNVVEQKEHSRADVEKMCKLASGFNSKHRIFLLGVTEVDCQLAAKADHLMKLTSSWSNVSRYIVLQLLDITSRKEKLT